MCLSFEAATIPEDLEPLLQRLPEGSDQEASCRKAVKAALHYLPFQALSNLQSRLRAASKDQDELEAVGRSLCEVLTYVPSVGGRTPHLYPLSPLAEPGDGSYRLDRRALGSELTYLVQQRQHFVDPVSGILDERLIFVDPDLFEELRDEASRESPPLRPTELELSHILPLSLSAHIDDIWGFDQPRLKPSKADRIRKTLLELCCSDEAARILNEDPNSLCNLLLLAPSQHRLFGQFNLALDAVHGEPNHYRVARYFPVPRKEADGITLKAYDRGTITLKGATTDRRGPLELPDQQIAPPSAHLLELHSALCKIVNASGVRACEAWDIDWHTPRIRALRADGSGEAYKDLVARLSGVEKGLDLRCQ